MSGRVTMLAPAIGALVKIEADIGDANIRVNQLDKRNHEMTFETIRPGQCFRLAGRWFEYIGADEPEWEEPEEEQPCPN